MLTRFAPAPTGLLHVGHVASAIHVWGLAARLGADVLLRVEDHDRQRSRSPFEAALLDDLDWLGFRPDRFPTSAFRSGPCASRQSDREEIYRHLADDLTARGLVYGCACSRQQQMRAQQNPGGPYPGTCRHAGVPPREGIAWRVRLDPGVETFDDLLCGPVAQEPATDFGDPVIRDRHGNWTYQFAVVADDFLQGIDLVVRGHDLLSSTGLQIRLARLAGRQQPARFAHHPLVMKTSGRKLSKSDGDTGIEQLRAAGARPADVIGRAAWLAGLLPRPEPIVAGEVGQLFARAG